MVQVSYPGVYIQEIPSGVRTITGVATSITAFIGRALSGAGGDGERQRRDRGDDHHAAVEDLPGEGKRARSASHGQ